MRSRSSQPFVRAPGDLDEWETVAQRNALAGWVPIVEWLGTGEGNSLKIQREDTARYFRLRLEPVRE